MSSKETNRVIDRRDFFKTLAPLGAAGAAFLHSCSDNPSPVSEPPEPTYPQDTRRKQDQPNALNNNAKDKGNIDENRDKVDKDVNEDVLIEASVNDFNKENPKVQIDKEGFKQTMNELRGFIQFHDFAAFALDARKGLTPPRGKELEGKEASVNNQAGGFRFLSGGQITIDGEPNIKVINIKAEENTVNHIMLLGPVANDPANAKNFTVILRDYAAGNFYVSDSFPVDEGDKISVADKINLVFWTQQVFRAAKGPNCNNGCGFVRLHEINPNADDHLSAVFALNKVAQRMHG